MSGPSNPNRSDGKMTVVALLPSLLALAWLISKAQWFWNHRPDLQFGWIVLLLSAFLIWDEWAQTPPLRPQFRWSAWLLAFAGLALLFLVQIYQAAFGTMAASLVALSFGILLLIAANLLSAYGTAGLKHFAFPLLFLLIALPLPSAIYDPVVTGLQSTVASINVELLRLGGIPAQKIGSLIQLPNGTVGINEACSGIRSLQSTVMATLFIGRIAIRSRVLQLLLLASGLLLAIFGNLVRSLFLSLVANAKGAASVDSVHDAAGWSILLFTAAGVTALAWGATKLEKAAAQQQPSLPAQDLTLSP